MTSDSAAELDAAFDIAQASIDTFWSAPAREEKAPVEAEAVSEKSLPEGVHIPDSVVQITGGPRAITCALDATSYVDGTEIACALQLLFPNEKEWQTALSFTVNERGKALDGSPALEWSGSFLTPFPLPDCQARAVVIVKGEPLSTKATIRW